MTSPSDFAEHILETAGGLFYAEGTKSVGVDRIICEAGVAKATMYRHFPSKDSLVAAYLLRRHEHVMASLEQGLAALPAQGARRVLGVFDLLYEKACSPDFRGCAFMLAVAENESSAEVREIACAHKHELRTVFERLLPPDTTEPARLALQLSLLYDGALAQILVHRDAEVALVARACAEGLVRQARRSRRQAAA